MKWDNATNDNAQFLVQPPGLPQQFRFSTGGNQSGHKWRFTWNPGEITWSADAAGGKSHTYSTREAIDDEREDHVQCLPANVDVRMNLWNLYGERTPTGMSCH